MKQAKKFLSALLASLMVISCFSAVPLTSAAENIVLPQGNTVDETSEASAAENELIVTFSDKLSDGKIEKTIEAEQGEVESISQIGTLKLAQVSVEDMCEAAEALEQNRYVQAVQPNYRYEINRDDPLIGEEQTALGQYQFEATNAFAAWDLLESGSHATTTVTAIDTGIDLRHEDLQANQAPEVKSAEEYALCAIGDTHFVHDDMDVEVGHGTHVNGIIGASYGNDLGGSGIAAGHDNDLVRLLPVGASADGYNLFTIDIVNAIDYAVKHGARVINMSFGGYVRDLVMDSAIQSAYYNQGVVFVAASGNEDTEVYSSPSDLKEVISVNASNRLDEPTSYSNFGIEKDVCAPGDEVMSTLPGDDYGVLSGTSMASPMVAGIAAMVLDANENLTPAQVYNILCASTKCPENSERKFDKNTAYGVIDAAAAVAAAKAAKADTPVEKVSVKAHEVEISVGEQYGAEVLIQPATALAAPHWSVDNSAVASVDPVTGVITAKKAGTTQLTVSAGGLSATQSIRVKPEIALTDIKIQNMPRKNEIALGDMVMPSLIPVPYNATFKDIYVFSSDNSVITVADGMLIPKKPGTATITIQSWDAKIQKQFTFTVKSTATDVQFVDCPKQVMLGETYYCRAVAYNADEQTEVIGDIEYSSGNKKVFTIDKQTGELTPVAVGKAYVTAKDDYSGEFEAVQVEIVKASFGSADYGLKQTKRTKNSVTISWNKLPVAKNYEVYRKDSAAGAWKKIITLGKGATSYTNFGLKPGKIYYYKVRALAGSDYHGKTGDSAVVAVRTVPDYKLKQSAKTKTSITLKWNKVPDATGYYVQYKASKSAKWKTLKLLSAKKLSFKHTGLKKGKTVYYRVMATYKVNGKTGKFDVSPAITAKTAR